MVLYVSDDSIAVYLSIYGAVMLMLSLHGVMVA